MTGRSPWHNSSATATRANRRKYGGPRVPRMPFGKYAGWKLESVPPGVLVSAIRWIKGKTQIADYDTHYRNLWFELERRANRSELLISSGELAALRPATA